MKFLFSLILLISFSASGKVTTFGIIGDAGLWNDYSRSVRDSLLQDNVMDLIIPGDNLYDPRQTYEEVWSNWSDVGFKFPVVAIGNHTAGYNEEVSFFKMPHEYYSKVIGKSRFIVLNSDNKNTVSEQVEFLQNELKEAKEPFIFLVYHHPPFSLRHTWQERKEFQERTRPLILSYAKKITSIIVGHDHIASLVQFAEIPVIVSGAVFESFDIPYVNSQMEGVPVKTLWSSSSGTFYWARLDVDEENKSVWVNFVSNKKARVHCSIKIAPRPMLVRDNCR